MPVCTDFKEYNNSSDYLNDFSSQLKVSRMLPHVFVFK